MKLQNINFPVEGIVQDFVSFSDNYRVPTFSFASPIRYKGLDDLKEKQAYLIASINPNASGVVKKEEIFSYYIAEKDKSKHPSNSKVNLQKIILYNDEDQNMGELDLVLPRSHFFKFSGKYPNVVKNSSGEPVAFCYFNPEKLQKSIYTFTSRFTAFTEEIKADKMKELEEQGIVKKIYTYSLVNKDVSMSERMEMFFSPSKKSESILNRISMDNLPESDEAGLLYLTAVMAFFWTTYIDLPMLTN